MKYQKTNWRKIRRNFKQNKEVTKAIDLGAGSKTKGLTSFMRNMDEVILNSTWQVISIENSFETGILKLWIMTNSNTMIPLRLKMKRTLYFNFKEPQDDTNIGKKVNMLLPRNRKVHNLYEWETEEENYLENFNHIKYSYLIGK